MAQKAYFRKILPVAQTVAAAILGGWGFWIRHEIMAHESGWIAMMQLDIWPWPLRFAAILNMPALLFSFVASLPILAMAPVFPDWASYLLLILFVPVIWFWVGRWFDELGSSDANARQRKRAWIAVGVFTVICAGLATLPGDLMRRSGFVWFGILIWLAAGIVVSGVDRFRKAKKHPSSAV